MTDINIPEEVFERVVPILTAYMTEGDAYDTGSDVVRAAAPLIVAANQRQPDRSVITAEDVTFQGCSDSNPDNCACGSWEPPSCNACQEDCKEGDEVLMLSAPDLVYLADSHPDQSWTYWLWHVRCDERASVLRGEGRE